MERKAKLPRTEMKKAILLLLAAICGHTAATAAGTITIKDVTSGAFRAKTMPAVKPLADGESYAVLADNNTKIVKHSFKTGRQTSVIFDINTVRGPKIKRIDGYVISPDSRNILIQTDTKPIYRRSFTAVYYIYNLENNKMAPLSDGGPQQTPVFSPDSKQIAFVRDRNIYLVKLMFDNAESQVTTDGKEGCILNGVPDWVNEEEFARYSSMVFSADSRQIVWVRYDESQVREYTFPMFRGAEPAIEANAAYPGAYSYKYPIAGEKNSVPTVLSYDIKSHKTRQMALPLDPDGYVPRLIATTDSSKVAVITLNRHQDCLSIYMANPLTTVCKLAIQDKVDKYINADAVNNIIITPTKILLPSDREGYLNLYVYSLAGKLQRKVANGKYDITAVYGIDERTADVYYGAAMRTPMEREVYVSHANGKTECLTPKAGTNRAVFAQGFKYFIAEWNDLNHPSTYTLCNSAGKQLATLIDNKELLQKAATALRAKRELFSFVTSEGVKLNGLIIRPADFNPAKRYPVIMYQYGGPASQQVLNSWNVGMAGQGAALEQLMTDRGFIVVCVDNRGTGARGAEFEKCTYMHLGELEAKDQVETALWLGRKSYVDKSRIGIWGWSYGGWNTLMSMSEGRGVFAAGVAVAPPTSWRFYDTVYTERYMRTPQENAKGYDTVNPIVRAPQLHGALMLCHGMADDNVHFRNTAEYTEALVQADKDFVQLAYNNRNHGISGGNTRNHLYRQIINFFTDKLASNQPNNL